MALPEMLFLRQASPYQLPTLQGVRIVAQSCVDCGGLLVRAPALRRLLHDPSSTSPTPSLTSLP